MRIPRFFASALPVEPGAQYLLEGDEAHHLGRVLRLRPGEVVELFDGQGAGGRFELVALGRRGAELRLLSREAGAAELPFQLLAAVATPRAKRAQRLFEALTELGVTTLVPLVLARSEGRPPPPDTIERWTREAAKQCGRNRLPAVAAPVDAGGLGEVAGPCERKLLPDPAAGRPLRELLGGPPPASVLFAIGPEGGFTEGEREALAAAGLEPARLGPAVLRIETAACAVAAAIATAWA